MSSRQPVSPKYAAARTILRYTSVFITDYRAATVYAALERAGREWTGKQWVASQPKEKDDIETESDDD